jgi:hypothetical protein
MKQTTNYIVYLDENNAVYCAKCRTTGKFVKRDTAQYEYSLEYAYKETGVISLIGMVIMFFVFVVVSKYEALQQDIAGHFPCESDTLDSIEAQILAAYQTNNDAALFKLYSKRHELMKVSV